MVDKVPRLYTISTRPILEGVVPQLGMVLFEGILKSGVNGFPNRNLPLAVLR